MIEAALTNGAVDGSWHADSWGVVFEVLFETEEQWQAFRNLPAVRAVTAAREWSRQTINRWHLGEAAEPIEHLVSELVTNSIEHAQCVSVTVLLMYAAGVLRLEVRDQDTARVPVQKCPEPSDVDGRGLVIVQALSDRWGVRVTSTGKAVWCEVAVAPPAALADRGEPGRGAGHGG